MNSRETSNRGRKAFEEQRWSEVYAQLSDADDEVALAPRELERLAIAAYLIREYSESSDTWIRSHRAFLNEGDVERAVRCACWLIFGLQNRGNHARASGWIDRTRRLLDDGKRECVEWGYLLLFIAFRKIIKGEIEGAYDGFCRAAEIAGRYDDPDLTALACHSRGRVRIRKGEISEGVRLLDEAMVIVQSEDLSPLVVGDVYCSVIEGCMEIFDLQRAQEWTAALGDWCASQSDLVPYAGQCLVHRAEILQLCGAWGDATEAAQEACEHLLHGSGEPAAGAAFYRKAELHRLRGEFPEAEEAYREANRWGQNPHPGMAMLRLYQGRREAAKTAICRAVNEAEARLARSRLLPAQVEILLAVGEVQAARGSTEELEDIERDLDAPLLSAEASHARGAVHLAEGDADQSLSPLRQAMRTWQELEAPYEAACTRVLIGRAYRELGDADGADMEFDAARRVFRWLGASPDLDRLKERIHTDVSTGMGGLTPREMEVLRLVAAGKINREIAEELYISEKTVARHVSNILSKLGVPNRAAATAYAYRHDLV